MTTELKAENVVVAYGDLPALHGISLEVKRGEAVAILGPNGAGKTTLVSALAGLLPKTKGRITFRDDDITRREAHSIADRGLCLVPQGRQLFTDMTVEENLQLGAYSSRAREHMQTTMEEVYQRFPVLKDRPQALAKQLSGGQQQMLTIARGLMSRPEMMMLDEPSLGLAPKIVEEVAAIVSTLVGDGLTVLLVEQNVSMALEVAERAYLLEQGRVADEGSSEELKGRRSIQEAYLGI